MFKLSHNIIRKYNFSNFTKPYIYLYDTTLRDGLQNADINADLDCKKKYIEVIKKYNFDYNEIAMIGDVHYNELSNMKYKNTIMLSLPTQQYVDMAITNKITKLQFVIKTDEEQIHTVINKKSSEYIDECIKMIILLKKHNIEPICAFEHFFDEYKKNKSFALHIIKQLYLAGSKWIVLADTNGGTLPTEIEKILEEVSIVIPLNHIGIHAHNDMDLAVANSITAVMKGVRMVQGTWNGMGERCGNANLLSVFLTLHIKLNYSSCLDNKMTQLTTSSKTINSIFGCRTIESCLPYVGTNAFAHKAGLHIHAVNKKPKFYEHIDPTIVGNIRNIILSDSIGRSVLTNILGEKPDLQFLPIAKKIIHTTDSNNVKEKIINAYKLYKKII